MKAKVDFNAPLTLFFVFISLIVFLFSSLIDTQLAIFTLQADFDFSSGTHYIGLVLYPFGHGSMAHLMGNMTFILLLGPILEEKYGMKKLLVAMIITTLTTAIIYVIFFRENGLMGASGIVFMFIILASFVNVKKGTIPLTFILVGVIFLGKEIVQSFKPDQISQLAHIIGGIVGAFLGFKLTNHQNPISFKEESSEVENKEA